MSEFRILVVDDELVIRDVVGTILKAHQVSYASGGIEGFEKFCSQNFDLVITDIDMPEGSGPDMIAKIRKRKPDQRILVLSGNEMELGNVRKKFPVITMKKPFRANEFRIVVDDLLKN